MSVTNLLHSFGVRAMPGVIHELFFRKTIIAPASFVMFMVKCFKIVTIPSVVVVRGSSKTEDKVNHQKDLINFPPDA